MAQTTKIVMSILLRTSPAETCMPMPYYDAGIEHEKAQGITAKAMSFVVDSCTGSIQASKDKLP
jgi:hypothetical protein